VSHIVFEVAEIALDPLVVVIFTDTVLNATIPMLFIVLNLSIINTTSDSADQPSDSSWHVVLDLANVDVLPIFNNTELSFLTIK
jgi:hypothetical protein